MAGVRQLLHRIQPYTLQSSETLAAIHMLCDLQPRRLCWMRTKACEKNHHFLYYLFFPKDRTGFKLCRRGQFYHDSGKERFVCRWYKTRSIVGIAQLQLKTGWLAGRRRFLRLDVLLYDCLFSRCKLKTHPDVISCCVTMTNSILVLPSFFKCVCYGVAARWRRAPASSPP